MALHPHKSHLPSIIGANKKLRMVKAEKLAWLKKYLPRDLRKKGTNKSELSELARGIRGAGESDSP